MRMHFYGRHSDPHLKFQQEFHEDVSHFRKNDIHVQGVAFGIFNMASKKCLVVDKLIRGG